jgi:hypothetical protein
MYDEEIVLGESYSSSNLKVHTHTRQESVLLLMLLVADKQ